MTTSPTGPAPHGRGRCHHVPVTSLDPARRPSRVGAASALVTGLGVLAACIALDAAAPAGLGRELAAGAGWPYALLGLALTALAAVVVLHDPRQRFGWALAGSGLFWSVDSLAQSWVGFGIRPDGALPGAATALWVLDRLGAFLPATMAVLLLIFPTGRYLPGRWGTAGRVALLAMLAGAAAVVVSPATGAQAQPGVPAGIDLNAATLPLPDGVAAAVFPASLALQGAGFLVAMATVVVRHRRSAGLERERLRWLAWAVLVMVVVLPLSFAADTVAVQDALLAVLILLPAAAMTVGIVDPRVVRVEELLVRTTVIGGLGLVVLGVDLAVLWVLTGVLGNVLDQRQVVLVVLALAALLYGPLRLRLERLARRAVLGRRADPYDAVAGLASTLESTDDATAQLAAVTRSVAGAFGIGFVSVEVDRLGGERLVAAFGEPPATTRELPITYRDTTIGRLVLPARGLRSRLSARDEQLLGDLVRQAATAARASRMAEELQLGRERMVLAREEERRRIRRDLHDGLGPALAGVGFRLESARLQVAGDPLAAAENLAAAGAQVRDVVADVRRLVHDLRPPALDDRGLVGALDQLAGAQPFEAVVEADALPALPAAVEVAAYRIAAEALTNAARHAEAGRCVVRLAASDGRLLVEVSDDGRGIAPDRQAGVGLLPLRERAAELGGTSEVTCPPGGGTRVRAWLPLGAQPGAAPSAATTQPEEARS